MIVCLLSRNVSTACYTYLCAVLDSSVLYLELHYRTSPASGPSQAVVIYHHITEECSSYVPVQVLKHLVNQIFGTNH